MSILNICDLSAGYHHSSRTSTTDMQNVINNISFSAEKGTIVGILGENGCGKTTLIKASQKYEQTIIMVTHDRQMADYADRIITISDGQIQ